MICFGKSFIKFGKIFINLMKLVSTRTCSSARVKVSNPSASSDMCRAVCACSWLSGLHWALCLDACWWVSVCQALGWAPIGTVKKPWNCYDKWEENANGINSKYLRKLNSKILEKLPWIPWYATRVCHSSQFKIKMLEWNSCANTTQNIG